MNYTILDLSPEIIEIIFDYLDLESQFNFIKTCKFFNLFDITNFMDLGNLSNSYITDDVLTKYPKIKYLNLCNNTNVKDINHLQYITKLDISGSCLIKTEGICKLSKLIWLNMKNNYRIKDLSYFTRIKYLDISGNCNITKDSIKHLKLDNLITFGNENFII